MTDKPVPYAKAKDKDWVAQKPGAPTARYTKLIKVPVKFLMTLPGLRGEHQVLNPKMEKVKCFIPLVQDVKWQREHPIEIEVHHNGSMVIGDGNHRKLAASLAHIENYLCKVTFYGGSEDEVNFDKVITKFASIDYLSIVKLARNIIANDGNLNIVTNTLNKVAEQEIGGNVDNFGSAGDQDYDNAREYGEDPAGENSPDKGQQRLTGPRRNLDNDMVQEAIFQNKIARLKRIAELSFEPFEIMHEHLNNGGSKPKTFDPPTTRIREDIDEETGKEMPPEFIHSRTLNPKDPLHKQVRKFEFNEIGKPNSLELNEPRFIDNKDQDLGIGADPYRQKDIPINLMNSKIDTNEPKLASSNQPCRKCGMPTDRCICMDSQQPTQGKNPVKTKGATMSNPVNPKGPSNPKMAEIDLTDVIVSLGNMKKYASHMEEVEIPFSDLKLENGVQYGSLNQESQMLITKYLNANVYKKPVHFTIADVKQEGNKFYVKCLVFDNQLNHEAETVTKANTLHKLSNVTPKNNLVKTAWKKRLVEVIGDNDETGLVKCPLEGGFLTRSCAVCPLAGNPKTYIQDGYTECHFDDMSSWLNGNSVKEHHKDTITGI